MSYQLRLRPSAQRALDKLSPRDYERIAAAISALEQDPRPRQVKKLAERGLWRLRVGAYRVVYAIDEEERVVMLVRVARRAEGTYRDL